MQREAEEQPGCSLAVSTGWVSRRNGADSLVTDKDERGVRGRRVGGRRSHSLIQGTSVRYNQALGGKDLRTSNAVGLYAESDLRLHGCEFGGGGCHKKRLSVVRQDGQI